MLVKIALACPNANPNIFIESSPGPDPHRGCPQHYQMEYSANTCHSVVIERTAFVKKTEIVTSEERH